MKSWPWFAAAAIFFALAGFSYDRKPEYVGRELAPDELTSLDGKPFSLTALNGRPALLHIFRSMDNAASDHHLPLLARLQNEYRGRDLAILGIAREPDPEKGKRFVAEKQPSFSVFVPRPDTLARWQIDESITYILLDKEGKVAELLLGPIDLDPMRDEYLPLLGFSKPDKPSSSSIIDIDHDQPRVKVDGKFIPLPVEIHGFSPVDPVGAIPFVMCAHKLDLQLASVGPRPEFVVRTSKARADIYIANHLSPISDDDFLEKTKLKRPEDKEMLSRSLHPYGGQVQFSVEQMPNGESRLVPKSDVPPGDYEIVNSDIGDPSQSTVFCFSLQ